MNKNSKKKLIRITTVPTSLKVLLKGQLKFMSSHFDVVGISSPGGEMAEVVAQEGIRVKAIGMSRKITPLADLIAIFRMWLLFLKEKPFIVHSHTPKAGLIAMVAAFLSRVPNRLHTVAGLPLMESFGIKRKVLFWVEKLIYGCATKIYPNSRGLEKFILENQLVPPNKLHVIGNGSTNGVDTNFFSRNGKSMNSYGQLKEQLKIKPNDFVYCFIGRVVKDKGVNELLCAFDKLSKSHEDIKLIVVGPFEDELNPINNSSRKILQNNKQVEYVGFQEDVRPYLSISHVLVLPSYREGFPNVVMQAGCYDLPCIVSNINGCNEIIENQVNGLVIDPKNEDQLQEAMFRMKWDEPFRTQMASRSRDLIVSRFDQEFIWDEILKEYLKLSS